MHLTYLFSHMDEASKLLEYITVPCQRIPTCYNKFSLESPLVEQVVYSVSSVINPTLISRSEFKVINSVSSVVDPTLPFETETGVVELISSPLNPTLSSESVDTEVFTLKQYSFPPSLPVESELKHVEVFIVSSDCSTQGEILSISKEPSLSIEIISFDWSNLT